MQFFFYYILYQILGGQHKPPLPLLQSGKSLILLQNLRHIPFEPGRIFCLLISLSGKFQHRGRFPLKGGRQADSQYSAYPVKQPPGAGGIHTVDSFCRHLFIESALCLITQPQLFCDFCPALGIYVIDHGNSNPPSLSGRCVPADLQERVNTAQSFERVDTSFQNLSPPDGAVCSVSCPVKGYSDYRVQIIIFRHTGHNMGVMMLNLHHRNAQLTGCHSGIIAGMHITGCHCGGCLQQSLHADNGFPQRFHSPDILHIAHIGRGIKQLVSPNTERIFQLASHCNHLAFIRLG